MRALAKTMLTEFARRLPPGARRALLEGLAEQGEQYEAFQALGRSLGVADIAVSGRFGLIEGSLDDNVLMAAYARRKTWSAAKNAFFIDLFEQRDGGTYIDVGANIGLTTIPIARNPKVACKAFEPEPSAFRHLARNVASNCPSANVELFNRALFDKRTMLRFELSDRNLADHRIRVRGEGGRFGEEQWRVIEVAAERLDDILDPQRLVPPIAVKITAQGSEAHIVAGGRAVLAATEAVAFQLYPYALARAKGDAEFLGDFLRHGFTSGAVMIGDDDAPLAWRPVEAVAVEVEALAQRYRDAPYSYYHVFARK
ncbi:MAG TPA: FkbM family methyltransferase [Alphaproteobacteria bacterium]|nr:FkbM family methyltransferase [Alphaproteobacteria bacterium]